MHILLILVFIFLVIYSCVSWLLPNILSWLFKRKFHINLKIARIAVPKLILKDVTLSKDGYNIHIDEVSFRSSFFNSDINKLVSVIIKGISVTNNVEEKRSAVVETILKPLLSKQNSTIKTDESISQSSTNYNAKILNNFNKTLVDFRDKKVPPSLVMFAQFLGVHIFNASINLQNGVNSPWSIQASAAEMHADGAAGGPARALVFSATLSEAKFQIVKDLICLGKVSCSILVEGTVKSEGPLSVEEINVTISNTCVLFNDDLYYFTQKNKKKSFSRPELVFEDNFSTIIPRYSPVIPKIFSMKIDTTTVSCLDTSKNKSFKLSLQSIQVNSRFSAASVSGVENAQLPQVYVAFQLDHLQLATETSRWIYLDKLKLDAKLEKGVLNLYLILSILHITYNHREVFAWYCTIREKLRKSKPMQINTNYDEASKLSPWLRWSLSTCTVQGCCEARSLSVELISGRSTLVAGWPALKLKLDQLHDVREEPYKSSISSLVLGRRHWSAELLLDSGWMRVGVGAGEIGAPARRQHTWRSALLEVALVKCASHGPKGDIKMEAMIDCLRFEWSPLISDTTIAMIECFEQYKSSKKKSDETLLVRENISCNVTVNVAMSHINVYLVINDTMCLMTRIDAVTVEKTGVKLSALVSGMKIVNMIPYKANVQCQRSDEISDSFFHVQLAKIEYIPSIETDSILLDFQVLENFDLEWGANLHLKLLAFIRALKGFKHDLEVTREGEKNEDEVVKETKKIAIDWKVSLKAESKLGIILSEQNHMLFATDDMTIAYDHEIGLSIVWNQLKLILNGDDIVIVEGYSMEKVTDDPDVRIERKANEDFLLKWNKVWSVNIYSIRVVFPFEHRFAEAVQGDFVSLFKWIKLVHGIKKKAFTIDSPLPSDLHIKIEDILLEMTDDPFEVKLRDNYELLEDEYKESQKRRTMLDAKVEELCKSHMFISAGKVEELYAALRQKDAEIYVQRCRAAPPPRTRLVACCVAKLDIIALADTTLHGTENALAKMREIDSDSPWPEEGVECSTLWFRCVSVRCLSLSLALRDFPLPLLALQRLRLWGLLGAAEDSPPSRAVRTVVVDQGDPWGPQELERSMMPLKWYYDLCCEMQNYTYAFGPCWEPVIAHCNLFFDQVSRPSLDPSAPLSWWDKVRLLFHGRLTASFDKFTCLLHVSLDPYNTTEEMEVTWNDLVLDWTNGKLGFLGELNVFVRTASKYDDCRVLRVPALRLSVRLAWRCAGEARDHRAAAPCAPARRPEYSSNQEHDSYRAFRSQALDLHLSMDTKPMENDGPVLLLYGSTLRWFESLKLILSGITRPTRRGRIFNNLRPRKVQLSRHYRTCGVSLTLHNLQVFYWASSSMQRGVEMLGVRVTCGSRHHLSLVPTNEGLIRRPRANWNIAYMNCDLNDAEIWLKTQSATTEDIKDFDKAPLGAVEKCFWMSVRRVSYGREAGGASPTHRLTVHDLRAAWTKINRDLAFALLDTYIKTQQLKKNLSTKALKDEEDHSSITKHQREADVVSPPPSTCSQIAGAGSSAAEGMLAALVGGAAGAGEPSVVYSDELRGAEPAASAARDSLRLTLDDDDAHTTTLIELVNSQVVLKGCEAGGYVLVCAARAEVRQRVRRTPAASAWSGALRDMQYFATVSAEPDRLLGNIQWVCVTEIGGRESGNADTATGAGVADAPRLVGSGRAAGGVLGHTVGPGGPQLQRIVSRCACEFEYAERRPDRSRPLDITADQDEPYDSFRLMHHDLDSSTNSLQYATVLDVINSVVLHVEPRRRRADELRARTRFQLQLQHTQLPINLLRTLQDKVRESLMRLRKLEKDYYYLKNRSSNDPAATEQLATLDKQVYDCKETVWTLGDELDAMVRAWRERERGVAAVAAAPRSAHAPPLRHHEICFKSARWRLTHNDGQLAIANLLLTDFLYTKTSRSDDTVEHQLEVGYLQVENLLPNEPFTEVLVPAAPTGRPPLCRRAALRVFCRDRPPVGGISVKEHFEVNIVPMKIGLTKKFFNTMLKFCFPERDTDAIEDGDDQDSNEGTLKAGTSTNSLVSAGSKKSKKKKDSNSNFYVNMRDKDDVEKMKERAEKNKLYIYIKIPEVPVRVSYKGSKEKNLEDVRDLPLVLPTLEYHNVTWTWLDLLLATKNDTRKVIVSQAIRQRLQLHRRAAIAPEPAEEDKARLLLGERTVTENKPQKKSSSSVFKFSKS